MDTKQQEFKARLYTFVLHVIRLIENCKRSQVTKVIGDRLLRSGTSILANYIEGLSASSRKDLTNYFTHSLKSSNESKVWIALLRDTKQCDRKQANVLLKELQELSNIFAASILTLKGKRNSTHKL